MHTLLFLFSAQCDCGDFRFNLLRMLQSRSFLVPCLTDRFLFLADSSLTRSFFFAECFPFNLLHFPFGCPLIVLDAFLFHKGIHPGFRIAVLDIHL